MFHKSSLILFYSLLAFTPITHGLTEGTVNDEDFAKIAAKVEDEEARGFLSGHVGTGSAYTFPIVSDLDELTRKNLWIKVDDKKIPVEKDHMISFYRVIVAANITLTAGDETVEYVPRKSPPAREASNRGGVTQTEAAAPSTKSTGKPGTKKSSPRKRGRPGAAEETRGTTYRLSCKYGYGFAYADEVISTEEEAGKISRDLEVDDIVDDLLFKGFPYSKDGEYQKLFRENQKKIEGLMSSYWGREKVLGTYAYYDVNDDFWKEKLLGEIVEHYNLGTITTEEP